MVSIVLSMLLIMVLAAAVVVYVAYPHRGMSVPHAPWLGEALRKTVAVFPSISHPGGRPRI